ncbi:uncharacterized protein LOC103282179 [Anolis carolinensis]|uniref:uncharacterized protein LOC103282179 n=1 Tax=Anolis carolinensis TaxID=28377 RepID=UPI002F2B357B
MEQGRHCRHSCACAACSLVETWPRPLQAPLSLLRLRGLFHIWGNLAPAHCRHSLHFCVCAASVTGRQDGFPARSMDVSGLATEGTGCVMDLPGLGGGARGVAWRVRAGEGNSQDGGRAVAHVHAGLRRPQCSASGSHELFGPQFLNQNLRTKQNKRNNERCVIFVCTKCILFQYVLMPFSVSNDFYTIFLPPGPF